MVVLVIGIAVWMAGLLTRRITAMMDGIHAFQRGDMSRRLDARSTDEMGELASSFNRMADSVEESFKRLDEAREKAEEASRQKSAFLATMSHELRTPLNGILGFADLLQHDLSDPTQQEYAKVIQQSGTHLLNLVNEILDLAKIESGEMVFKQVPTVLATLLEENAAGHRIAASNKGLSFKLLLADDLPLELATDPMRLRQILNNLLNNAVKFTEKGEISLSVRPVGSDIAFIVRDTGVGIPAHSLGHDIREIQATRKLPDPRARRHRAWPGTGAATGRTHGWARYRRIGSWCRLDLYRIPAHRSYPMSEDRLALVVDDQPTNRLLAATLLKRQGWNGVRG